MYPYDIIYGMNDLIHIVFQPVFPTTKSSEAVPEKSLIFTAFSYQAISTRHETPKGLVGETASRMHKT